MRVKMTASRRRGVFTAFTAAACTAVLLFSQGNASAAAAGRLPDQPQAGTTFRAANASPLDLVSDGVKVGTCQVKGDKVECTVPNGGSVDTSDGLGKFIPITPEGTETVSHSLNWYDPLGEPLRVS
ncbi:hypothetical protein [Streptomyces sp. URMC 123]|uniref:hypothetical protein n=1 Tax=Streptomyces sp. URMC 123 TaxID=3423403 RepID=UPI003F1C04CA